MKTFKMNLQSGLLEPVYYCPSPHQDARPDGIEIDTIVIHGISLPPGEFGSDHIKAFFCGELNPSQHDYFASIAHLRVSSHLLIKRTGEIVQFVPFMHRAWHAGESFFRGRSRCNDFSIGIELEGTDYVPYEQKQYEQLITVVCLLMQAYKAITIDKVVGHADIAPGRKTDPGPSFNWHYLKGRLA